MSGNPSPKNPVALRLAALDRAPNVIYLARPCQYITLADSPCTKDDWTGKRFSAAVVQSYQAALDQLKQRYPAATFHVTGFSGGANIAGLLAAQRTDIASLRTVAGNVDNDAFVAHHNVSAMPLSLTMADAAPRLSHIPQHHYIGADDTVVPRTVYESYARQLTDRSCAAVTIVPNATHTQGWESVWAREANTIPLCAHSQKINTDTRPF